MRIIVVGPDHPHCTGSHMARALRQMGHQVQHFADKKQGRTLSNVRKAFHLLKRNIWPSAEKKVGRRLFEVAADFHPDLVLGVSIDSLYPGTVERLRQGNRTRVVAWFPDALCNLGQQLLVACNYDCVFTKCRDIEQRLIACGRRSCFLPEACAPEVHSRLLPDPEYTCEVTTAASYYPYRVRMLEVVQDRDLKLWWSWPRFVSRETPLWQFYQGRDVYLREKATAFSSAQVVVNTLNPGEANSTNVRLFEAACSGTLVLTEYRPVVEELYEVGEEIDVFSDRDELRSKVLNYLARPQLAAEMGRRAAARSQREHTYECRLTELLEETWRL